MSEVNTYFDKIFYINLDRRPDRNEKVLNKFANLGITNFERFSAVDAKKLNLKYSATYNAEIATLLSHLSIYKIALERNYKNVLIFEDDVLFDTDFNAEISTYLKNIPIDWDLLYLGGNDRLAPLEVGKFNRLKKTYAAHAYAVNQKILPFLINYYNVIYSRLTYKNQLEPSGFDYFLTKLPKKYNCYSISKYLVFQEPDHSDIQHKTVDYNNWLIQNKKEYEKQESWTKKIKKQFKIKNYESIINKIRFLLLEKENSAADHTLQVIIFSKNRALQLHALLESMRSYRINIFDKIKILYHTSTPEFEESYSKLKKSFPEVTFIKETDFRKDLLNKCIDSSYSHTCFLVDDNIFYQTNPWSKQKILNTINFEITCFSLRLGMNCTYSHPANKHFKIKKPLLNQDIMSWNFNDEDGDFNYPLAVDGHIYSTKLIIDLIKKTVFKHPNTLEGNLQKHLSKLPTGMVSFKQSILVGLPINIVNTEVENRAGAEFYYSEKDLNKKYLNDEKIDLEKINLSKVIGTHQEVELFFISNK